MKKAVVIPVGEKPYVLESNFEYEELREILGGSIEGLPAPSDGIAYINENGKWLDLSTNIFATFLYSSVLAEGDFIAGNIVIFGEVLPGGDEGSVDDQVAEGIISLWELLEKDGYILQ